MKKHSINVGIYAPYDLNTFNLNKDDETNKLLQKIYSTNNYLDLSNLNDKSKYNILLIDSNLSKENNLENFELIYKIDNENNNYKLSTGRFIGELNINNINLSINSGYSDIFERRLLNYSNDIYLSSNKYDSINENNKLRLVLEYLYLSSLRKSLALGFPKYYQEVSQNDFNIKGNININKYLSNIKNNYKGIPYTHKEFIVDKIILSVLYKAYSLCNSDLITNKFIDIKRYFNEFNCNDLLKNFRIDYLNKSKQSKSLSNNIYSSYKKVLNYATVIIKNKLSLTLNNDKSIASGWLIDISELFELYLYKLIKNNFKDYTVLYQEEIPIYNSLFISRKFIPDIVMKKGNDVIILDAKFKKMDYNKLDVDRSDLQQIHTYYTYYKSLGYNVKFSSLIYPVRVEKDIILISNIFDNNINNDLFGISYILVGNTMNEQIKNENLFIERLRKVIE